MTTYEILRLRAENARLEQEAEWLANILTRGCNDSRTCDCLAYMCDTAKDWREAAHKAISGA